jgi:hypothetical protein
MNSLEKNYLKRRKEKNSMIKRIRRMTIYGK